MSATLEQPRPLFGERRRPTLEQTLEGVLYQARAGGEAECPLCHERMTLRAGEAECQGCGSRLS
jgi:hypothetical protein